MPRPLPRDIDKGDLLSFSLSTSFTSHYLAPASSRSTPSPLLLLFSTKSITSSTTTSFSISFPTFLNLSLVTSLGLFFSCCSSGSCFFYFNFVFFLRSSFQLRRSEPTKRRKTERNGEKRRETERIREKRREMGRECGLSSIGTPIPVDSLVQLLTFFLPAFQSQISR